MVKTKAMYLMQSGFEPGGICDICGFVMKASAFLIFLSFCLDIEKLFKLVSSQEMYISFFNLQSWI